MTGEYVGSREYQPGVPVRRWDYASWARLGLPVVREFAEPRHPSVAIIVDTTLAHTQSELEGPVRELEAVISLAASVSDAMVAHGNRIELLVVGKDVYADRDESLGDAQLSILEHLALAQTCQAEELKAVRSELEQLTVSWDTVIYLSQHWHNAQQDLYEQATLKRMHATRVLVSSTTPRSLTTEHNCSSVSVAQIESGTVEI